jgi:hypothetical protein
MNWEYNYLIILCKLLKQQLRVVLAVKGNWLPIPTEDTLAYIVLTGPSYTWSVMIILSILAHLF